MSIPVGTDVDPTYRQTDARLTFRGCGIACQRSNASRLTWKCARGESGTGLSSSLPGE